MIMAGRVARTRFWQTATTFELTRVLRIELILALVLVGSLCAPSSVKASDVDPLERILENQAKTSSVGDKPASSFRQGVAGQTITRSVTLSRDILSPDQDAIIIAADDVVLDCGGHVISGSGSGYGVKCIDCNRVTVTNCGIREFEKAIYLGATDRTDPTLSTDNSIIRNELTRNEHGVYLLWSHRTKISKNLIVANTDSGISLTGNKSTDGLCSNDTTISGNTISRNRRGLVTFCPYLPQEGNVVENNTFSRNVVSVTDRFESESRIRYQSNTFDDNLTTVFLQFAGDHVLEAGAPRQFDVAVQRSDGEPCSEFVIKDVVTSPQESVSFSKIDNRIVGNFTPRRQGLYSMNVMIVGCEQEFIKQRYWFGEERSKTLYLTKGKRRDAGKLVSMPPQQPVYVWCTMWVEAAVQDPPKDEGIAKITRIHSSMWSNYIEFDPDTAYSNVCSVEFDHTYSRRGDVFVEIDGKYEEGRAHVTEVFNKGLFLYDSSDWRDLTVKYWGRDPDWISEPGTVSQVEISYLVTRSPVIKSISNHDVRILSATSPKGSSSPVEIVLQGEGKTSLSIETQEAKRRHKISFDGTACGQSAACNSTQQDGVIRLDVALVPGREHTIAVERETRRQTGG
jgi:parallel beta-helix repeat protein